MPNIFGKNVYAAVGGRLFLLRLNMSTLKTYGDKLRDPKWQRKRLEVLNRDNWTCLMCSDFEANLQVHHKSYDQDKDPWQYKNSNFQTLCEHCHPITELYKPAGLRSIVAVKRRNKALQCVEVTTIFIDTEGLMTVSIDRIFKEGSIKNVVIMERGVALELENLFVHAETLINNGNL